MVLFVECKMFFILKYCGEFEFNTSFANVRNFLNLKKIDAKILNSTKSEVSVFLFVHGTEIVKNDYLYTLEDGTELFICKHCHREKLKNYFDVKRYLELECCSNI